MHTVHIGWWLNAEVNCPVLGRSRLFHDILPVIELSLLFNEQAQAIDSIPQVIDAVANGDKKAAAELAAGYNQLIGIDTRLERLDKTVAENERRIRDER